MSRVALKPLLASVAVAIGLFAAIPSADAYIYWTNKEASKVARAFNDGLEPNQAFTGPATATNSTKTFGIAVDDTYIYWTAQNGRTINRSRLDGSQVEAPFFTLNFGAAPTAVAVDGSHIYWADPLGKRIGRANLDGTGVIETFINTSPREPRGVAVDSGHIYWTTPVPSAIGRADINGSNVVLDFVSGTFTPYGIAVDSNYIYWGNNYSGGNNVGTIGRVGKDGTTDKNTSWIAGTSYTSGVAVDSSHVYWVNENWGNIGRANLDGTGATQFFASNGTGGSTNINGVAVDAGNPASPTLALVGKATKTSLKLSLTCGDADACQIALSGKKVGGTAAQKITAKTVSVAAGASAQTTIAYSTALKRSLAKGGRIALSATRAHAVSSLLTVRVAR